MVLLTDLEAFGGIHDATAQHDKRLRFYENLQ